MSAYVVFGLLAWLATATALGPLLGAMMKRGRGDD